MFSNFTDFSLSQSAVYNWISDFVMVYRITLLLRDFKLEELLGDLPLKLPTFQSGPHNTFMYVGVEPSLGSTVNSTSCLADYLQDYRH